MKMIMSISSIGSSGGGGIVVAAAAIVAVVVLEEEERTHTHTHTHTRAYVLTYDDDCWFSPHVRKRGCFPASFIFAIFHN